MSSPIQSKDEKEDSNAEHGLVINDGNVDWSLENRLKWKLDIILIPLFMLIYCTNFVDRTAIGNAKIAGLEKDLGLAGFDYNIALTTFYVAYILIEVPSNLALKHFGSIWLALLVTSFGAVSVGTAFVRNYAELVVTRVLLGLAEGGTLSGLTYLMSRFYRRSELVMRIGIFFGCSTPLAGAFGGLLASAILGGNDIGSVVSWRKIFLVEGVITTGFGIFLIFFMPDDPATTKLLSHEERKLALARIQADQVVQTGGKKERTTVRLVLRSINFNSCLCTLIYILLNVTFQGLSLFMPTVVASLGHYTTVQNQLRTVPPYMVATVWSVSNSYLSFRFKNRSIFIFLNALIIVVGYIIAISTHDPHARYAACFLAIAGASPGGPLTLVWGTDNAAPETVRAVTTALIPGVGAAGAVVSVWTYLPTDAPDYHKGNSINLGTSCASAVLVLIGYLYMRRENRKRERGGRDYRLAGKSLEEIRDLGWKHPDFRYQL